MANANTYGVGATVRLRVAFTDAAGNPADPSAVVATILAPGALAPASLTVVHDSAGVYHADFVTTAQGPHFYKFVGTGNLLAESDGVFVAIQKF